MKKLLTIALAFVLAMSLAVSVAAFEGSADVSLYLGNDSDWVTVNGDTVTIDGPGEYTLTLTGLTRDSANLTVLYIKDVAVEAQEAETTNLPSDIEIITKSLKINGEEIALDEGYPTTLNENGVFDVCYYNIWATSYFKTLGMGEINEVTVVFEVVEGAAAEEAPAEEEAPATEVEDTPATEEAPADDTASEPADTGLALAVVPMLVAAVAVVASKRR